MNNSKNEIYEVEFITLRGDLYAIVYEISTTNKREYIMTSKLKEGNNHADGNTMEIFYDNKSNGDKDIIYEHKNDPVPTASFSYMKKLYRDYIIERIKKNRIDWNESISSLLVDGVGTIIELGFLVSQIIMARNAFNNYIPDIFNNIRKSLQLSS